MTMLNIPVKQFITLFMVVLLFTIKTVAQTPVIKDLKSETVQINGNTATFQSGYIDVPEDWEKPDGKILKLPVTILKSSVPTPAEPIFWLTGGPGLSNLLGKKNMVAIPNHDFVCVGYRGADGSVKLTSKKVSRAFKGKGHRLLSDESLDAIEKKMNRYLHSITKKGINISKYTMLDVIEDLEYVRKALGANQVNLISESYGTRLALLYGYKYPQSIKRTVMIGANPPGHFVWYPDKTEEILTMYDSLYKAQNPLTYQGSIKQAIIKAFDNMPKRWRVFKLDADKIKVASFITMFSKSGAVQTFDAFLQAANKKDYSGLCLLQFMYDINISKKNPVGDLFQKGASADFEPGKNYRDWLKSYKTTLGPNLSLLYWGIAKGWYNYSIPDEFHKLRTSKIETLIISGNLDVSTPADYATRELLPTLPNGKQVIIKDYSHSLLSGKLAGATIEMMLKYIETGIVDDSKLVYDPVNFTPKTSLNKMAKKKYLLMLLAGIIK